MKRLIILVFLVSAFVFNACKKKLDQPPITDITGSKVYSVSELKSIASCTTSSCSKRFSGSVHFVGVVIADEISGNFYKELYVRDRYNTGGIHVDLLTSSNFFVGDSIRLSLQGYDVNFNSTTGMLEIDSVDWEKNIVKFGSGAVPLPRNISLYDNYTNYFCDLVSICGVHFSSTDTNQIYADAVGQMSLNRLVQDCGGNSLTVRTSNYAKFAGEKTPSGFGSITGIATAYQGTNQMALRKTSEVSMAGPVSCNIYLKKDWNDNSLTSGGWTQQSVLNGSVLWNASTFGTATFAKISGYISGNQNSENWLISPSINMSNASNPVLSFVTAAKFAGSNLEVMISTNYTSGAPSSAIWLPLSGFALSPNNPGSYAWTASGMLSLANYKSANTRIAFKYTSTTSGATTYELDDVVIRENCN